MNKQIIIFCASLFLIIRVTLQAQIILKGKVVDYQTKEPVAGATILIEGTNINTTTNEYGKFVIESPNKITKLKITRIGYITRELNNVEPGESLYILLTASPVKLTGVEVVGSNQLLRAQSIGVLTKQDLNRFSGLSLTNSINNIPGIFMQSRTPWGGSRITIRGYYPSTSGNSPNSNGLGYQVFLNNIPVTDASGTTVLDNIDFSSLGSVEIIKGPSSSLYGSFIGGAVNLTTVKPVPNQSSFNEQVIGGSDGLFRTNTTIESSGANSSLVLNYGHQTYNSFRPHSASKKDFIILNGDFRIGSDQNLSTYFSYDKSYEELAGEIDSADFYNRLPVSNPLYLANNSHIFIKKFLTGITDNYHISEYFNNSTTLFGSGFTSNQPFAHGFTDVNQFNFGVRTLFNYTAQTEAVGINGKLGGMFQQSNLTSNGVFIIPAPPFPERPSDQENYAMNFSVFTEWSFALPLQFNVTVGASLNKNEFGIRNMLRGNQVYDTTSLAVKSFDPVFTPRISLSKVFNNMVTIYAGISSGYTPPLLSDAVASDGSVDLSLKPERAVQYEIGSKGNLFNNKFAYQFSLFDLENTNKLVRETSNSFTYTTNAGKQRNEGLELSVNYLIINNPGQTLSLLRPWASYTYSNFKYVDFKSSNNAGAVDYSGNYVARVPKNMINLGIDLQTNPGIYFYGTYQYVDKVPVTFDNSTYVKAYSLLSAKIGYKKQLNKHFELNIFAGGDNLLSSTYYTFLFVGPNINGLKQEKDGGSGDGYIIPGNYKATFYGNITISYIL